MEATKESINKQINECLNLLKNTLGSNLAGVYVYGSLLQGGLQKFSDIDLFAVVNEETSLEEKERLEDSLLKISGVYGVSHDLKPIELTIVVNSDLNPWQYPPKFDFLYGDWLRKEFENGTIEPWKTKTNPNLALVITQLLLSNKILFGPKPSELLPEIPYKDFIKASTAEIDSLMGDLDWDTRNVLLTLARVWCTLEMDSIRSKADATSWAIEKLPNEFREVLENAKAVLLDEREENWIDLKDQIKPTAEFIIEKINENLEKINSSEDKKITIA